MAFLVDFPSLVFPFLLPSSQLARLSCSAHLPSCGTPRASPRRFSGRITDRLAGGCPRGLGSLGPLLPAVCSLIQQVLSPNVWDHSHPEVPCEWTGRSLGCPGGWVFSCGRATPEKRAPPRPRKGPAPLTALAGKPFHSASRHLRAAFSCLPRCPLQSLPASARGRG